MNKPTGSPDGLKAISLPLLAIAASLLVSGAVFTALGSAGEDVSRTAALLAGSGTLAALGLMIVGRQPPHRRRLAVAGRATHLSAGLGLGLLLAVLAAAVVATGVAFDDGARERLEDLAFTLPESPALLAAVVIAVVVLAPIGEELVFRAVLLRELAGRIGARNAVLASAVIFTAAHADAWLAWPRALSLFVLGIGFALVYRRFGLLAAIGSHAAVNLSAVVLVMIRG